MANEVLYAACALIRNELRVVGVARRGNEDDWGLPGGKPEQEDESLAHTAARELLEETGIVVQVADLREVFRYAVGPYMTVTYEAERWVGEPTQQPGESATAWVTWGQLLSGTFKVYNANLRDTLLIGERSTSRME